ncbi:SUKH-3 domain-containing protein [Kribbella sp. NPDC051718]|uniref:SUKH-3 domain-containing protein n=1 Tax=Kribbella sp. NPDC051718 TaxID=3155168 RepID=UPI0034336E71
MAEFEEMGAEVLVAAGWKEGRRVAVGNACEAYLRQGYQWPDFVEAVASEFGGLIFGEKFGVFGAILTMDAALAVGGVTKERVEEYEEFLELKLFPVGVAAGGVLVVLLSPDGSFRGGYDDSLEFLGNNVREMLGRLSAAGGVKLR